MSITKSKIPFTQISREEIKNKPNNEIQGIYSWKIKKLLELLSLVTTQKIK